MFEKRLKEIVDRKLEIRTLLSDDKSDLKAIKEELDKLEIEERSLKEKKELAARIEDGKAEENGEVRTLEKPKVEVREMDFSTMSQEDLLKSTEYRSAYLKNLQGKNLSEIEKRALTTASNSAGAAVPTTTFNMIIDKLRQTSVLFPKINVTYIPGNLSLVVSNAKNAAAWKNEGTDGTPADDTVVSVNLGGFELIKLVEISAAADAMTLDAFESYISSEIGRQLSIAIENAILNGTGSGQPTGIITGVTWDTTNSGTYPKAGLDYDSLVNAITMLPTMYRQNGAFIANSAMFANILKVKDSQGRPLFTYNPQDNVAYTILGRPLIIDDYMPADTIIFGDPSYYYMNFSKSPEIAADRSVSFKSGKITYRGLAVADGKPALSEAFIKLTKATA